MGPNLFGIWWAWKHWAWRLGRNSHTRPGCLSLLAREQSQPFSGPRWIGDDNSRGGRRGALETKMWCHTCSFVKRHEEMTRVSIAWSSQPTTHPLSSSSKITGLWYSPTKIPSLKTKGWSNKWTRRRTTSLHLSHWILPSMINSYWRCLTAVVFKIWIIASRAYLNTRVAEPLQSRRAQVICHNPTSNLLGEHS
jgi:hypothetical protein